MKSYTYIILLSILTVQCIWAQVQCPHCTGCFDCDNVPEYREICPEVCMIPVAQPDVVVNTNYQGFETEYVEPVVSYASAPPADDDQDDCPKCEGCIDCNAFPDFIKNCPSVCNGFSGNMMQKRSNEAFAKKQPIQPAVCPDCKGCVDCRVNPQYIDLCPNVCQRNNNVYCPMCMGCLNCSKNPYIRLHCPQACGIAQR